MTGFFRLLRIRRCGLAAVLVAAAVQARAAPIVIDNVTIIDTAAATPQAARLPGRSVMIEGDRITRIGSAENAGIPPDARRIDGKGRFLLPALWDAHVHVFGPERQKLATMLLFLANGVTSVRDMGHDVKAEEFDRFRSIVASGRIDGPRIIATPFRVTDGGNILRKEKEALEYTPRPFFIDTAEDGRALARYVAEQRFDFIKPYDSVPRTAFFAMMAEARARHIMVGGHVPMAVTVAEAAEAGMGTLEHARSLPFNCSKAGSRLLRAYDRATASRDAAFDGGAVQNDGAFLRDVISGFDAGRCEKIFAVMKRAGMAYVPTHVTRRMDAMARQLEFRETPLLRYIHPDVRAYWQGDLDYYATKKASDRAALMEFYYHGLDITRRAAAAGVTLLIGTDASDTYVVPGFSIHQEMYELVGGGLAPLDVLRAATHSPAAFFGALDRGMIAAGNKADMVLLAADPLDDIANTRRIEAVFHDGKLMDRTMLDAMLERAAALVAPDPAGTKTK